MSFIQRMRLRATCLGLGLVAMSATPGLAAERVIVRLGPLSQSIELSDLETFAETGEVPEQLKLYQRFLSPSLQRSLRQELELDPRMSDRIIDDVLASANGELLLDTLGKVAPNVTIPQIQAAIRLAARQTDGLNMLDILRAIPQETLEVDVSQAVVLVSQLNLSNLESRSLSGVLDQELRVEDPPPILSDIRPELAGEATVFQQAINFEDRDRDRIIPVELYWTGKTKGPLVVLSHGFGADRFFLDYIGKHLASHGLTVVSVEHPGSNLNTLVDLPIDPEITEKPSRILPAQEFLDRPKDVSFVLDQLERLNQRSVFYRERFRTQEVSIIGHSLGGYTGLALAGAKLDLRSLESFCKNIQPLGVSPADWLQCAAADLKEQQADLTDSRIQQVIAMNTLTGQLFGEVGLSEVTVPTLLLTGTKDSVTPTLDQQLNAFTQLSGEKYLLAVIGGTHLSVGDPGNVNPALTELPFMAELKVEETANLRQLLQGISLSFVKQQTTEAADYKPFLSSAYVQSFSTVDLPLRLVETLPDSIRSWLTFSGRISANTAAPTLTSRLIALSYLGSLAQKEEWQRAVTAQLQANQVVTMLRSPLPFLIGW